MQRHIDIWRTGGHTRIFNKEDIEKFPYQAPGNEWNEGSDSELIILAGIDKDSENIVKSCKSCASVTKAPPIKLNPWPKTDKPWSRVHIDYASPIKRTYF